MAKITLKANVNEQNNFTYTLVTTNDQGVTSARDQPFDLDYKFKDEVTFECNKGPFTMTYRPFNRHTGNPVAALVSPFGSEGNAPKLQVRSNDGPAPSFKTEPVKVVDPKAPQPPFGIKPIDLMSVWETQGHFTAYHYELAVDGGPVDSQINGMWICGGG